MEKWTYDRSVKLGEFVVFDSDNNVIARVYDNNEADTKLITTAPELSEALKELLNQVLYDCSVSTDPKYKELLEKCINAKAAIQKAGIK